MRSASIALTSISCTRPIRGRRSRPASARSTRSGARAGRTRRSLQRHRRADRGGPADHRDRRRPGRAQSLARRRASSAGSSTTASRTGSSCWRTGRSGGAQRRKRIRIGSGPRRPRRAPRRDPVRDRAGLAARACHRGSFRCRDRPASRPRDRRAHAVSLALTRDDVERLDGTFACSARAPRAGLVSSVAAPSARPDGEVVLIMGLPGAGKSTLAATFVARGYTRLNRDEAGGTLAGLLPVLDQLLASGVSRDRASTTPTCRGNRARPSSPRRRRHGLPVRCIWLSTSVEDAQVNAASRIVSRYGRLLVTRGDAQRSQARHLGLWSGRAVPLSA